MVVCTTGIFYLMSNFENYFLRQTFAKRLNPRYENVDELTFDKVSFL